MGKWRAILPITIGLVVALGASLFIYLWMQRQVAPKEVVKVAEFKATPLAVAAVDLPWGTQLTTEMLKVVPYPTESIPAGHFSGAESLKERVLIASVKQNEPILESKLAPTDVKTGGVAAIVTPGKRALAVKGDKVIGISGFILPGNRVDILATLKNPRSKSEVTKVVLENILVLATGAEIQKNDKGEPAPVDVYTLEVTPEEGEKLSLAATNGKLQFALRNFTDAETVLTKGATITETLSSYKYNTPAKRNTRKRRVISPPFRVEVIKGNESKTVKF
jgi:pilus assembly protein CpaB